MDESSFVPGDSEILYAGGRLFISAVTQDNPADSTSDEKPYLAIAFTLR